MNNNDWILFSEKHPENNQIVEIVWMYKLEVEDDDLSTVCRWINNKIDWDCDMLPYKWR